MNKGFDSEPVYGDSDKYIKTKIKSFGDKMNTNYQGKKMPKENILCKYLTLVILDSVIRVNKNRPWQIKFSVMYIHVLVF